MSFYQNSTLICHQKYIFVAVRHKTRREAPLRGDCCRNATRAVPGSTLPWRADARHHRVRQGNLISITLRELPYACAGAIAKKFGRVARETPPTQNRSCPDVPSFPAYAVHDDAAQRRRAGRIVPAPPLTAWPSYNGAWPPYHFPNNEDHVDEYHARFH